MLTLALRNVFRNRLRTALTLAAIACGVAAIIVSGGFVEDVFVQLREATIRSRLGHVQISRTGFSDYGRGDPFHYLIDDPREVLASVRALPQVRIATTRIYFSGLANNGRGEIPIVGEGIDPDNELRLGTATVFVSGRALGGKEIFEANVGEGLAHALKFEIGSPMNVTVSTPSGALNVLEFSVAGIFRTFSKDYDDHAVRISRAAAAELLNTGAVHSVVLGLDDTDHTDAVVAQLATILPAATYEIKPWHTLADFYNKTVALYRRQFGALQLVIFLLLVLSVASTVNMVIHERTGEFGTLMALGARRREILGLVLVENAILGLLGGLIGVVLGVMIAVIVSAAGIPMPPPPGSAVSYTASIRLVPTVLAIAAATGAVAAILAAVLPGRRAARLPVVEALRHNV